MTDNESMFMRVGPFLFIGHLILFVEYCILFKFSGGISCDILNLFVNRKFHNSVPQSYSVVMGDYFNRIRWYYPNIVL